MKARAGDWLIVKSRTDHTSPRRAVILAVHSDDGAPPYTARWADNGHQTLVFPGPDAQVISAAEEAQHLETTDARIARIQSEISAHSRGG